MSGWKPTISLIHPPATMVTVFVLWLAYTLFTTAYCLAQEARLPPFKRQSLGICLKRLHLKHFPLKCTIWLRFVVVAELPTALEPAWLLSNRDTHVFMCFHRPLSENFSTIKEQRERERIEQSTRTHRMPQLSLCCFNSNAQFACTLHMLKPTVNHSVSILIGVLNVDFIIIKPSAFYTKVSFFNVWYSKTLYRYAICIKKFVVTSCRSDFSRQIHMLREFHLHVPMAAMEKKWQGILYLTA